MLINREIEKWFIAQSILIRYLPIGLLGVVFLLSAYFIGNKLNLIALLALLPLVLFAVCNFRILLLILPSLLFFDINVSVFSISELFISLITLSFLLTHYNILLDDIKIPLKFYLLGYLIVLGLSVLKSTHPLLSVIGIHHYLIFLVLLIVLHASLRDTTVIKQCIVIYLFFLSINTFYVFTQAAITGKRVFGFSGIMYVDYVGIGIILSIILVIFAESTVKKFVLSIIVLFFIAGLILTQTRTSWISTGITFLIIFIFISINHSYYNFNVKSIRRVAALLLIVISIGISSAILFNPNTIKRVAEIETASISETGMVSNSLVSRAFIWHTAYNAFVQNPVLGIGAYAFPFSSQNYYSINKLLYKTYVEKLSPHQTFIAVAVETGIIGVIVFISLYVALIGYLKKKVLQFVTKENRQLALLLGGGILYCLISMFTTDAWLWGHGIVLFALFLGMFFSLERLETQRNLS